MLSVIGLAFFSVFRVSFVPAVLARCSASNVHFPVAKVPTSICGTLPGAKPLPAAIAPSSVTMSEEFIFQGMSDP